MMPAAVLACAMAGPILFASAYAHTLDSVGDYRLELQWEVEPPYSGEVNAVKIFVSPMVPGLELEEQPFQNGVEGLEDTIKIQLGNRDHVASLLLQADEEIPGLYRAYVKVLRPGYYQVNILGDIGDTPISLSMHPHEVLNAEHVTFPREYGELYELGAAQEELRAGLEEAALADEELRDAIRYTEMLLDGKITGLERTVASELFGNPGDRLATHAAVVLGGIGVALGGTALYVARRSRA